MDKHIAIDHWIEDLTERAQTSALADAIRLAYAADETNAGVTAALTALSGLSDGDASSLPTIQIVDRDTLNDAPGAYSPETDTIFIRADVLEHQTLAAEVLTHELGHAVANRYFGATAPAEAAYDFTHALLGQDHALILSSGATHQSHDEHADDQQTQPTLTLPDSDKPIAIERFDTGLHIDWARAQLPMLNAKAFELLKLGQNDSDAFIGPARVGVLSPYGLQTDSNTHFDNNNIRGSMEVMSKRWSDALDNFNSTKTPWGPSIAFGPKTLVAPSFEGDDAGRELMMYRFGQITHALQDFYSHSNWIESVRSQKIREGTLLDSGLDLPTVTNPGEILKSAGKMMVAMSGPNYSAMLEKVGVGGYDSGIKNVYWWVNNKEGTPSAWGTVFGNLKISGLVIPINALMTGAVNGAIYYDTDYSLPLRAVDRTGFFEKEYFRGFSHGGAAGAVYGQWISPLAKDKENNGRFSSKAENKKLFEYADEYAGLQVRNEFDRMGNLIYKKYGVEGLQKFADFALTEATRDLFVSTYSTPGARWDWSAVDSSLVAAQAIIGAEPAGDEDFHFDDANLRFIEVFYEDANASFTTMDNREYVTQVFIDGQWFDAAERLINTHHDHMHDYGPEAFLPAETQHATQGGRMVYSGPNGLEGHHLGTVFSVANVNTQVRVYLNHFDVGLDVIQVVDAQGNLIEEIDVDRANYPETRQYLLDTYNITVNARAEMEVLTQAYVIRSDQVNGALTLQASEFFVSPDVLFDSSHSPSLGIHHDLRFVEHDGAQSWIELLDDGTLQISDISQAPQGRHDIYVAVSDEASLYEGAMISLVIDPEVSVAGVTYNPESWLELSFRNESSSAVSIYGLVVDEDGVPVSYLENIGTLVGDASGLPANINAQSIYSHLADPSDHGDIGFFARYYGSLEDVTLDVTQTGQNQFALSYGDQVLADLTVLPEDPLDTSVYIDEIYVQGIADVLLGMPLNLVDGQSGSNGAATTHEISIQATASREAYYDGEFGFFLADLQSGLLVDPGTGILLEDIGLNPENVGDYSVFSMKGVGSTSLQSSASFSLDGDLNLDNLALFPYYQVDTNQGSQLFLAGELGQRDGVSHIARVGTNTFGVEDMIGGDYDFDDFMLIVDSISIAHYV